MEKRKNKRLKLKPSARDKRRYLLISGGSNEKIEKVILDYIGILGFAKSAYVYVKKKNSKVVGSCLRENLNDVRAGLAMGGIKIEKVSVQLDNVLFFPISELDLLFLLQCFLFCI